MTNRPESVTATLMLMLLSAAAWLAFGVIVAGGLHPALPDLPVYRQVLAYGSFAAGAVLACLFILLRRRIAAAWYLAVALSFGTCVATIFDDVGLADVSVIAVNLVLAGLLIRDRRWYLRAGS